MSVEDSLATNNKSPEIESAEAWIKLPIQILILTLNDGRICIWYPRSLSLFENNIMVSIEPFWPIKPKKLKVSHSNSSLQCKMLQKLTWSLQMSSFKYPEIWLVDWFDQLGFPAIAEMRQQAAIALGLVIKNSSS